MRILGNGEIYYEDQEAEYKLDLKNKECVVCKYQRNSIKAQQCSTCDPVKKNQFVASKTKN